MLLEVSDSDTGPCTDKMHGADCKKSLQNYICILDGMGWAWVIACLFVRPHFISTKDYWTILVLFEFPFRFSYFFYIHIFHLVHLVEDFPVRVEDRQKYDLQLIKLAHDVFSLRQIQELIAGPPQSCVWRQVLCSSVILSGLRDSAPPHCGLPVPAHYHFYLPTIPWAPGKWGK